MSFMDIPNDSVGEEFTYSAGNTRDTSLIPGSVRSPGEGNGNAFQYSSLKYPMDRGAWRATVHELDATERLGYEGLDMT